MGNVRALDSMPWVRLSYFMTTTLSARGQIVIPSDVRRKLGLKEGDDFVVICSADREILLRPPSAKKSPSGATVPSRAGIDAAG